MKGLGDAACVGENPHLFDVYRYPEAWVALTFCSSCPAIQACLDHVRPSKSHYDGVAGGVVWRNGYRVRINNSTREDAILRARDIREEAHATAIPTMDGQRTMPVNGPGPVLPRDWVALVEARGGEGDMRMVPQQTTLW